MWAARFKVKRSGLRESATSQFQRTGDANVNLKKSRILTVRTSKQDI